MYIIVGLGNPESKRKGLLGRKREETRFAHTRHNVGFDVLGLYAMTRGFSVWENEKNAIVSHGRAGGEKVILVKPQTYMNRSGECVRAFMDYYKESDASHVIIVCDDINLDPGMIRIRAKGSAGGHNGLKDIFEKCGTQEFPRIRVGVGAVPRGGDMISWVLGHMDGEDKKKCDEAKECACDAIDIIMGSGINDAMSRYNKRKETTGTGA